MTTIEQLRRLAAECRSDREKVMVAPEVLDALLDLAERTVPPGAALQGEREGARAA